MRRIRGSSPAHSASVGPAGLAAALETPGLGFPVVLKATGRLHKSEGGGVVVGLADRDRARAAYDDLVARLAPNLQVFAVASAGQILAGLLLMALVLPALVPVWGAAVQDAFLHLAGPR